MTRQLTVQERIDAYTHARDTIVKGMKSSSEYMCPHYYVCVILMNWLRINTDIDVSRYYTPETLLHFPEFAVKKPTQTHHSSSVWWPISAEGHSTRVHILNQCINELTTQSNDTTNQSTET